MDLELNETYCASCTTEGHVWGISGQGKLREYEPLGSDLPCTPLRTIELVPSLQFKVNRLCVHPDGGYAILTGEALNKIGDSLAVVDLRGGKSCRKGYEISTERFLLNCPGVSVKKLRWVPDSASHFAVLTSNNRWGIFDARDPLIAVQTYKLDFSILPGWSQSSGVAVSFDFCPRVAWGHCSVMFLRNDHSVFLVCPVVAPGIWVSKRVVAGLSLGQEPVIQKWCSEVFKNRPGDVLVTGELPDWWTEEPTLQGPLNNELSTHKLRMRDPGADIKIASCHGVTIVYTITVRGVVSAAVLDGDIHPRLESQLFAFDIHRPMLAPHIVLRQASTPIGLIAVSEAVLGKARSDVLEFLSHPLEDDFDQVVGVVRENGVFIIQNPALKFCLQRIQSQTVDRNMERDSEAPIIDSFGASASRRNSKVITGYFRRSIFYAVYSKGLDLAVNCHTINELPAPSSRKENGLCARKLSFDSPDPPVSKETLRCSVSSLPTVGEDSDDSTTDVMYNLESVIKFLDGNISNLDEKLPSVNVLSKILSDSVRELNDQSPFYKGIEEKLDRISTNALPLSEALVEKLGKLHAVPMSNVEGRNLDEGMLSFAQEVNTLRQDVEAIIHSFGQDR